MLRIVSIEIRRVVLALIALLATAHSVGAQSIRVTDVRDRTVTLPGPATRVLIDDGRFLIAMALVHPDPVSLVAAWPRDINRVGQQTYDKFKAKFPKIETIPQIASSAETFSLEQALAIKPSVAVFSLGQGPSDDQLRQFAAAGIPVVFIDFFNKPFANQERSLQLLGDIIGRSSQARAFVEFRRARLAEISERLKSATSRPTPKVFLEAHAGISADCCNSPGKGNLGDYLSFVGAHNIGADVIPGAFGKLNLEYVIAQRPAVYVATGGPHLERQGGFVVGPSYTPDRSRQSLGAMAARPGVAQIAAVREGRVYGLSHQLINSPLDVVVVEVLAKWIHPDLFRGLNPERTLTELNSRFLAVPIDGPLWVSLR